MLQGMFHIHGFTSSFNLVGRKKRRNMKLGGRHVRENIGSWKKEMRIDYNHISLYTYMKFSKLKKKT